ncbi:hypothetical protein BH20BAC1_BH20BAC1_27020 [soil metagenome]
MKTFTLLSGKALRTAQILIASFIFLISSCKKSDNVDFPLIELASGFNVEKVAEGLTFPTGIAWDSQNEMYVLEAGGGFLEEPPPARIVKIMNGQIMEVVNLKAKGVVAPVIGFTFHNGNFFISHKAADMTGAVSRVSLNGATVSQILSGFIDGGSEHPVNDIRMGPDGRMYLATGPAGNSAVMGPDVAPFVSRSPSLKTTSAKELVLLGVNFKSDDFRTPAPGDSAITGAYVTFGTATTPGQRIAATNKPGGSIVSFDPNNAEATLQTYAFGFRNVIGLAWNSGGELFAAVNGFDVRGSRPVRDNADATYRVTRNTWYGWPDFSASLEPLTDPKFEVADSSQAMTFINGVPQGKNLGFVIDHQASELTPPDKNLVAGLHTFHSSPSMLDVAPASWGDLAGRLFVAEWGDLTPPTDPKVSRVGYRVVQVNPASKEVTPFISNKGGLPGSEQNSLGRAIERPFSVRFGPDGAMYIVDYGQVKIDPSRKAQNREPYAYVPGTGVVWKVTKK